MPRLPKKNVRFSSAFETLPHELATEILGRVAASSVTDMVNAKLRYVHEYWGSMHASFLVLSNFVACAYMI